MHPTPSTKDSTSKAASTSVPPNLPQPVRKSAGYGLPCAHCRTYYWADLKACPVCKCTERVAVIEAKKPAATSTGKPLPKSVVLDFKAPSASSQTSAVQPPPFSPCIREQHHQRGVTPAVICQDCYEHVQEHILESALNMDVKQVARIIYEAIVDPSEPSKASQNVAHALVSELRKPSGATPSFTLLGALATISCRLPFR